MLLFGGAALAFAAVALAYPSYRDWSSSERSFPADRLRLAEVARGAFEQSIAVDGKIVAVIKPTLFASAEGVISLEVKPGDFVEQGDVLAVIDNPELTTRLRQAETALVSAQIARDRQQLEARQAEVETRQSLEVARVTLDAARRTVERYGAAMKLNTISAQEFDRVRDELVIAETTTKGLDATNRLRLERLRFEVESSELEVKQQTVLVEDFQRQVDSLTIRSPIAGQVGTVHVDDKDSVAIRAPVLSVVDLAAYGVEIAVPESFANDLRVGLPAVITYEGLPYRGELTSLSPEVIGSTIEARARFIAQPKVELKQNQRVTLKILVSEIDDTLRVARGPFVESGGGRIAYRVRGSIAEAVPVRLGVIGASEVEILDGLEAGDRIVISNTQVFENASKVLLR